MSDGARERAIEEHLPLVRSIARRYAGRGEPLDDLVQVGTIGLIKAVDRFDPTRERDLAALARPSIEGEIRHHLRDRVATAHVPRPARELAARTRSGDAGLTRDERATGRHAEASGRPAAALDEGSSASGVATDETEAAEARALLAAGWDVLDERERRMLHLRYHDDLSQAQIARELGLSQAHVSRLLRAALQRLRDELAPGDEAAAAPAAEPERERGRRSGRILLRVPPSLHEDLVRAADDHGVSLNAYVGSTLAAALGRPAPEPGGDPGRVDRTRALLTINAVAIGLAVVIGLALLAAALLS